MASPEWRRPGQREAGGEFCGGAADGSGCWNPALSRGYEETHGMKLKYFGRLGDPWVACLWNSPHPGVRSVKKPTEGMDLGYLLNL